MKSVRIWYKKSGLVIYTSHLDMNRCFTRSVRMANIPLWYTEGFNPHPYMTFLLPLPLGTAGLREPIDIRIEGDISNEEISSRLNSVLPEGLEIVDVTEPVHKVNEIVSAKYEISVEFLTEGEAEGFAAGAESVIKGGELLAEKKTKKGMKTVNLCEMVNSFSAESNKNTAKIVAVLATGQALNLNANLLMDSLLKEFGAEPERLSITRTEIYIENNEIFE